MGRLNLLDDVHSFHDTAKDSKALTVRVSLAAEIHLGLVADYD